MKPFSPHKLPIEILDWAQFVKYLGPANRALARYDGLLQSIPNPVLLLSPLTTQEAVLSSKIEGTQATLEEVLRFEANPQRRVDRYNDIQEVINYRKAMAYAVHELKERPINLNMLKRTHSILLDSVRGQDKARGEFRKLQNWIGKPGSTMEQARFVPPTPEELPHCLDVFEKYIHFDEQDALVQLAIVHAQFEIIHPFLDGNGRIGRILIPLFLFHKTILHQPMFYISAFLESNREEYYDRLKAITEHNDWEGWILFFLQAVEVQAKRNISKARTILELYNKMKQDIPEIMHSQFSLQSLEFLFNMPVFTSMDYIHHSGVPKTSVSRLLIALRQKRIIEYLEEPAGRKPAVYIFRKLIDIVNQQEE